MRSLLTLALLSATASAQLISSFETEEALAGFTPSGGATMQRVEEHASEGRWALKVFFPGSERDTWPGITIRPPANPDEADTFVFDAYNPDELPAALSMRVDPVEGDAIFTGIRVPPKASARFEINLRGLGPIKQLYPYIRMPRRDWTLYLDNFRYERYAAQFTPVVYVDNEPPPQPTAEQARQGFILFQRPFTDPVFANARPRPEETLTSVDVVATPGEWEPVTVALYALEDLKSVRVSFEGIPAQGEVYPIRHMDKRVTYSDKRYIQGMPVLCERRATVDVPTTTCKRFLLDMHIAEEAPPGVHRGKVTIQREGADPVVLPLRLRVLPFRLAEPTGMYWGEYYVRPRYVRSDEEFLALLPQHLADMRAHGMTSVGLCFGPPAEQVMFAADGTCQLNLPGNSPYERFMDLYRDLKFSMPVVLLSDSGQGAATKGSGKSDDTPEWAQCYQAFWRAMQAEHKRRGWPEVIVQPVDEPGWQGPEEKARNVRCLKLLKQILGLRTEQDGPGDGYFHKEAGPFADLWNYNGALAAPEVIAEAQKQGKTILIYNCDVESYRPEVDRYTAGWFQVRSGASGCFNWAYVTYGGDAYDDQDSPHGDWMHIYPPLRDEPGGPSTGWIGAREGVDDFRYVATLRAAIERGKAVGGKARAAADAAQQELEAILASLDYSPSVRGRAQWTQMGTGPDGRPTIGGTLKQPNGWEHSDYDRARWKVARATWAILAALEEAPEPPSAPAAPAGEARPLLAETQWSALPTAPRAVLASVAHHVTVPVWRQAPTLDGDLGDEVWQSAAKLQPFTLMSGAGAPQQQTEVFVGSDGRTLYLAALCHEDNMAHLTARVTQDGGPVWQDDCIEVFVDPTLGRSRYHQIIANSLGVQGWNSTVKSGWRASSVARTRTGPDRWTVELAVPLADLGITGDEFGFNVCRERRPMETLELSCWSPTVDGFGQPARFGIATLGQAWIGALEAPPARLGTNELRVTLRNETDQPAPVSLVLQTETAGAVTERVLAPSLTLAAHSEQTQAYGYELQSDQAVRMTLQVLTAQDPPRLLAERSFAPTVLPALRLDVRPRVSYLGETRVRLEVTTNLAPDLRETASLGLRLCAADARPLRTTQLGRIEGDHLAASLDLAGLAEGTYTLTATLEGPQGRRLAETRVELARLLGPFD